MNAALLLLLLLSTVAARATSIWFPKFGKPIKQENLLIFTSHDNKRVLAVSLQGKKLWENRYTKKINLLEGPDGAAWLQEGTSVSRLTTSSGTATELFQLEDANDLLVYDPQLSLLYSKTADVLTNQFKIIQLGAWSVVWRHPSIRRVVTGSDDVLVFGTSDLAYDPRRGYHFYTNPTVMVVDRRTLRPKWQRQVSTLVDVALIPPYLIITETDKRLFVLSLERGTTLNQTTLETWAPHVSSAGTNLVYLSAPNISFPTPSEPVDFNQREYMLHFCSLPDLQEFKRVTCNIIEAARFSFEGDLILTDALYRVGCFTQTGEKLWEKFQMNRTGVIDGMIYFSDNQKDVLRLGAIDVATGKERILYTEDLPKGHRVRLPTPQEIEAAWQQSINPPEMISR